MPTWKFAATVHSPSEGSSQQYGEVDAPDAEAADAAVRSQARAQGRSCGSVTLTDNGRRRS